MIDPARWSRIEELFAQASELPSDQRAPWLSAACGDDVALRQEVESLLAASAGADPALDAALVDAVTGSADSLPGGRIGAYRIVRELGRGGMGAVFLAERADGEYEGQVAIKVSREGPGADEMLRRLRAERQILANLQHRNIARLLDGGTTTRGAPYVVMEYVEGTRIDRYCDEHRLDLRARIALIRQLADAVEHANRNLVIHRDIKPGNILVTADGTPKLLDFGIAKLLEEGEAPGATKTAVRLLTPAYASPEQFVGDAITTASDVYSLGVVAYEVLAGRSPYPAEAELRPADLLRLVTDAPITRPSVAITTGDPTEVAARRAMSVEQLRRAFAGDLDAILLTALRKEPERRYRSAGDFGADLGRYLEGLPVSARPDTVGYRAAKFIRRHRIGVATSVTALAALIAFITLYTVRVTQERNRAVAERAKAEQVTSFLTSVFELANPEQTRGESISAVDLLHGGAQRVADSLGHQPEVQATMMHTIGQAYVKLGLPDSARRLFDGALAIRERAHGRQSREVAVSLMALGEWYHDKGLYDSALVRSRQAVEILDAVVDGDDQTRALGLYNLGWILFTTDDLVAADSVTRLGLDMRMRLFGAAHAETAESQNSLATILLQLGKLDEAEALFREALTTRRQQLGPKNPLTGFVMNNLAVVMEQRGQFVAAESLYREVVDIDRRVFGPDSPRMSTGLVNLGRVLGSMQRFDEAEASIREAQRIDALQGTDHPYVAYDLRTLGDLMLRKPDLARADQYYREALAIYRRISTEQISTGSVLRGTALVRLEQGRPEEAEAALRETLQLWSELPEDQPDKAHVQGLLGLALARQGRDAEAEPLLVASRAVLARAEPGRPRLATITDALGELLRRGGRADEAAELEAEAQAPRP
jgi:serine/threonine-protein kinase